MIHLCEHILVNVQGQAEYHIDPRKWYSVIGTETRPGKEKEFGDGRHYLNTINTFIIVTDQGKYATVYPDSCQIRRANGTPTSYDSEPGTKKE